MAGDTNATASAPPLPGQPCRQLPPGGGIIPAGLIAPHLASAFISDPLITLQVGSWAERGHATGALLHPPTAPSAFMGRGRQQGSHKGDLHLHFSV